MGLCDTHAQSGRQLGISPGRNLSARRPREEPAGVAGQSTAGYRKHPPPARSLGTFTPQEDAQVNERLQTHWLAPANTNAVGYLF